MFIEKVTGQPDHWADVKHRRTPAAPRLYVGGSGVAALVSNVDAGAITRTALIKELKRLLVTELPRHGYDVSTLRFSRYAGCTCPCSPGFIVESPTGSSRRFQPDWTYHVMIGE